jgi:acetylornithine deacetylase/succinyl-diaminopimelate desuccinylase-like protein
MKTVVATYLVWMKDMLKSGGPFPNISLMLVGNEENGEAEAWGTPYVLKELDLKPSLFIAGERTGEKGNELFGEICVENRGVMRFDVVARGAKGHSGVTGTGDLSEKLIAARSALNEIFARHLTLKSPDGWQSQAKFPFINVGTPGIYNVTAGEGILGVEIRPIPQDDVEGLKLKVEEYCAANGLELCMNVMENGVACSPDNPALKALIEAVKQASLALSGGSSSSAGVHLHRTQVQVSRPAVEAAEPKIGKKLPGTSARFAPGGQAVVWGQSGIGPHAKDERHYIPSIEPYYRSLNELAKLWKQRS